MKQRPIYYNLYWLRAISCLTVVLIHAISITMTNFGNTNYEYVEYVQLLLMYATPSFVIISEFLIASAYKDSLPKGFFKKRIKYLLIPYISIGLTFAIVFADGFEDFLLRAFKYIILADSIAYFVIIILQFYILHFFLAKYLKNIKPIIYLTLSLFINVIYLVFFRVIPAPEILGFEYFFLKGHFILFPAWLFYFSFGYFLGSNYSKIQNSFNKYLKFYFIGFVALMVPLLSFKYFGIIDTVSSKRIDVLLYTVFFVLFIMAFFHKAEKIPPFISFVNKYSFNIYLIHTLPLNLISASITDYFWLDVAILFIIGLIFSVIVTKILHLTPIGAYIVGNTLKVRKSKTIKQAA